MFCPFCCRARWEEYRWDWQSNSVKQALLLGPPRNTGLICPLYVASREAFGDELQDVYAYALTTTEEEEEERLISKFDPFDKWVTVETQQDMTQCFQTVRRKHNKLTLTFTLTWLLLFGQTCRGAGCLEKTRKRSIQGRKGGFGLCSLQPGAGAFWTLPECYAHFCTVLLCSICFAFHWRLEMGTPAI